MENSSGRKSLMIFSGSEISSTSVLRSPNPLTMAVNIENVL